MSAKSSPDTTFTPQSLGGAHHGERALRDAMGHFATGVTVVTALDPNGDFMGMTVNSFSSVSLDPPLILWSIGKGNFGYESYQHAERFCVNVLASDQGDLALRFARAEKDKFQDIAVRSGLGGVPMIENCRAYFECTRETIYPGGDHVVLIGRVERSERSSRKPLIFYTGRFFDLPGRAEGTLAKSESLRSADATDTVGVTGKR